MALTELEALPEVGRDAMSGWLERAQTHNAAMQAVEDLLTDLNTN
jgi:hypothetical protein